MNMNIVKIPNHNLKLYFILLKIRKVEQFWQLFQFILVVLMFLFCPLVIGVQKVGVSWLREVTLVYIVGLK